jgi:drug/metabolite transporter (DMT)-like permease
MTGELAALGAALAFGLSLILARRSMVAIAPEAGVLVSIVFNVSAFVLLTLGAAWRGMLPPIDLRSIALFAFGGLVGTLLGRNLSYQSMQSLGATLATSIRLSNSIFTLLLGYALLHELPRPWQLAGLALVTAGLWLSLRPVRPPDAGLPRALNSAGVIMALAGAAAFAFGDTARRLGLTITPAPVLGAAIGAGTALVAHLAWSIFRHSARWPSGRVLRRLDLIGSAVCNTMAILLLYVGLQHAPVAIVSVLYNLQVLVVLILGPVILRGQEMLTGWLVAGTCVALAGTVLILLTSLPP